MLRIKTHTEEVGIVFNVEMTMEEIINKLAKEAPGLPASKKHSFYILTDTRLFRGKTRLSMGVQLKGLKFDGDPVLSTFPESKFLYIYFFAEKPHSLIA